MCRSIGFRVLNLVAEESDAVRTASAGLAGEKPSVALSERVAALKRLVKFGEERVRPRMTETPGMLPDGAA